jgi:hypothetical protein
MGRQLDVHGGIVLQPAPELERDSEGLIARVGFDTADPLEKLVASKVESGMTGAG